MAFNKKDTIEARLSKLERIIQTIGVVQQEVVEVVAKDNPRLQANVIAAILALDENRKSFTEWLNEQDDVPDNVKTFMMDVNEGILDMKKELDNE